MRIVHYIFLNTLVFLFLGNTSMYGALAPLPKNAVITNITAFEHDAIDYAIFALRDARGEHSTAVVDSSNDMMLNFVGALNTEKMAIEKGATYQHMTLLPFTPSAIDNIKWNLATDLLLFKLLLRFIPTKSTGFWAGWGKSKRMEVTGADKQDLLKEIDIFFNAFKQDPVFQKYATDITQLIKDPSVQAAFESATSDATLLHAYQDQHALIVSQYAAHKISTNPFVKFLDVKIAQLKQLMVSTDPNYASEPTLFDAVMDVLVQARAKALTEDTTSAGDRKAVLAAYNTAKAAAIKKFNKAHPTPKGTQPKGGVAADATPAGGLKDIVKQKAALTALHNRLSENALAGAVISADATDSLDQRVTDALTSIEAGTSVDPAAIITLQKEVAEALQAHKKTEIAAPVPKLPRQTSVITKWEKAVENKLAEGIPADPILQGKLTQARATISSLQLVAEEEMHRIKKAVDKFIGEKFVGKKPMPSPPAKKLSVAQEAALQKMKQDIAAPALEAAAQKDAGFADEKTQLAAKIDEYLAKNSFIEGPVLMGLQGAAAGLIAKGKKIVATPPVPPAKTKPITPTPPDVVPDVVQDVAPEPIDPVIVSRMVHELAESLALLHSYETI